jgi:hypothetical protein
LARRSSVSWEVDAQTAFITHMFDSILTPAVAAYPPGEFRGGGWT